MSTKTPNYKISLFPPGSKQCVGRRDVPDAALEPVREQIRFQARRRAIDPAADVDLLEQPLGAAGSALDGVRFSAGCGAEQVIQEFGLEPFQYTAERWTQELIANKTLTKGGKARFKVFSSEPPPVDPGSASITARVLRQSLPFAAARMADYLKVSKPCGPQCEDDYPVFLLAAALEQAEQLAAGNDDVEGGAWLIGNLYHQVTPQPEVFGVIHTVLRVHGAEQKRDSLNLSTASYYAAQQTLSRRRVHMGREGELVFGLYHTHPFLPSLLEDRDSCANCPLISDCNATSSFFSQQDAVFHRAVFGRAAYAVQMVQGLTPRREPDLKMFCFDGGLFRERGYYRLSRMPSAANHA
jgi:hypothetical protein